MSDKDAGPGKSLDTQAVEIRFEALGRLTNVVLHELVSPLHVLLYSLENLDDEEILELLPESRRASLARAHRSAKKLADVLDWARKAYRSEIQEQFFRQTRLSEAWALALKLLKTRFCADIDRFYVLNFSGDFSAAIAVSESSLAFSLYKIMKAAFEYNRQDLPTSVIEVDMNLHMPKERSTWAELEISLRPSGQRMNADFLNEKRKSRLEAIVHSWEGQVHYSGGVLRMRLPLESTPPSTEGFVGARRMELGEDSGNAIQEV